MTARRHQARGRALSTRAKGKLAGAESSALSQLSSKKEQLWLMMEYLHQFTETEKIAILLFSFLSFFSFEASGVLLQIRTPSKESVTCKIALFKPNFQRHSAFSEKQTSLLMLITDRTICDQAMDQDRNKGYKFFHAFNSI